MKKEIIFTPDAPKPIGPYSQAIRAGGVLYCSGQIPLHPGTGEVVGGTDVVLQAEQALKNLKAVLECGGATLQSVLKVTLYLKSMADFPKVNEVYARYFSEQPPARVCIEAARLPKDVLVEVDAIATVVG